MKIKFTLFAFLTLLVIASAIKLVNSSVSATVEPAESNVINPSVTEIPNRKTSPDAVNNETDPASVPDAIAYTMVFRLISSHKTEAEFKRLRGYVQQNLGITDNREIDAVFRLADDFKRRTDPIDDEISFITERYHPNHSPYAHEDQKRLDKLKKDKEKIIYDLAAEMPFRLGETGKNKFHKNVQERVKKKIKILP